MIKILWHVYRYGHSVQVNRAISVPMGDSSRGWLYKCECGEVWAR